MEAVKLGGTVTALLRTTAAALIGTAVGGGPPKTTPLVERVMVTPEGAMESAAKRDPNPAARIAKTRKKERGFMVRNISWLDIRAKAKTS